MGNGLPLQDYGVLSSKGLKIFNKGENEKGEKPFLQQTGRRRSSTPGATTRGVPLRDDWQETMNWREYSKETGNLGESRHSITEYSTSGTYARIWALLTTLNCNTGPLSKRMQMAQKSRAAFTTFVLSIAPPTTPSRVWWA
jgi:hypothetical protein